MGRWEYVGTAVGVHTWRGGCADIGARGDGGQYTRLLEEGVRSSDAQVLLHVDRCVPRTWIVGS